MAKSQTTDFDIDLRRDNKFNFNKQRYFCNSIKLSKNETEIEFENLQFALQKNGTNFEDLKKLLCDQSTQSSTVPIIVGCVLLAVMGVALGIYLFMSHRSS